MNAVESPTSRLPRKPRKQYRQPVVSYDRAGHRLAEYASASAAHRATGIDAANLSRVANREPGHATAGGCIWLWTPDPIHLSREYRRTGDVAFRNKLIESHVPLVRRIADVMRARLPREVQRDDLVSVGVTGL